EACPEAEQKGVIHSQNEKTDGEKNAVANSYKHLPTEKYDQIVVDRFDNENDFFFCSRPADGQVIGPISLDSCFLQEQVKKVDRDHGQANYETEPRRHPRG